MQIIASGGNKRCSTICSCALLTHIWTPLRDRDFGVWFMASSLRIYITPSWYVIAYPILIKRSGLRAHAGRFLSDLPCGNTVQKLLVSVLLLVAAEKAFNPYVVHYLFWIKTDVKIFKNCVMARKSTEFIIRCPQIVFTWFHKTNPYFFDALLPGWWICGCAFTL
jgi:hypothetical protein